LHLKEVNVMNRYRVAVSISLLLLCSGTASAADAVAYWNDKVIGVTIAGGRSNPETGVAAAYMHIAIYDAISSIDGRFTPFLTRVANVPPGASPEAAAAEAAYRILANLYPAASFPAIASQFATAYNDAVNAIPNSQAKSDGMAVGLAAANGLIAKRQNDGFRANVPYVFLPLDAGVYQKTPGADGTIATYAGPVTPWMAKFKPLAILSPDQFRVDGPPALGSRRWAKDFNEVKNFGAASTLPNSRSAEQEEIGLFYGLINAQLQIGRNLRKLAIEQNLTANIAVTNLSEALTMYAELTGRQFLPRTNSVPERLDELLFGQLSRLQLVSPAPKPDSGIRLHADGQFTAAEVKAAVEKLFAGGGISVNGVLLLSSSRQYLVVVKGRVSVSISAICSHATLTYHKPLTPIVKTHSGKGVWL